MGSGDTEVGVSRGVPEGALVGSTGAFVGCVGPEGLTVGDPRIGKVRGARLINKIRSNSICAGIPEGREEGLLEGRQVTGAAM